MKLNGAVRVRLITPSSFESGGCLPEPWKLEIQKPKSEDSRCSKVPSGLLFSDPETEELSRETSLRILFVEIFYSRSAVHNRLNVTTIFNN